MKSFINARTDLVTEALDGFLSSTTNTDLARLDGYPDIKVVLRSDWDRGRVALISGGGSGHEPAHAGFVGEGMLTAAVCGEVFASPSVDAVLSAILAVTGEAGALLIIKNYTGDRLNFGLAAERARAMGRRVETVIVADDIAIPDSLQARGVAGTLFVHKVAGFLAAAGAPLDQVAEEARRVADECVSLGLSLETCTIPGTSRRDYLTGDEVELGLGIHGEPGATRIPHGSADDLMAVACERLAACVPDEEGRYAVLVNNLGSVPRLEMNILTRSFLRSPLGGRAELLVGPAPLMTSLDMKGFSLSLLPLDDLRREALAAEVTAPDWPGVSSARGVTTMPLPSPAAAADWVPSSNPAVRSAIDTACGSLVDAEVELNDLDARTGDGDAGSTFAAAARALRAELDRLPCADSAALSTAVSEILSRRVGGSSGVLTAILFAATGEALANGEDWPTALMAGAERMMLYGGARPGDRTMLDALLPAVEILLEGRSLTDAATAARRGADGTRAMTVARAGRSAHVGAENLAGVTDPGAEAVARILEAVASTVTPSGGN
ncbi:MAG TPA: DAK2 domain-containing protein [Acidimicrobiales bacterium]|nr:DAK2 domain-containing protein [Acidimicrobiales bacterium]